VKVARRTYGSIANVALADRQRSRPIRDARGDARLSPQSLLGVTKIVMCHILAGRSRVAVALLRGVICDTRGMQKQVVLEQGDRGKSVCLLAIGETKG
jgi:hypothetical protein